MCGVAAHPLACWAVYGKIKITARCADIRSSALILSGINLTRIAKPSLIQDTATAENTTVPFPPKSFRYMHLFQQCDALLLMGGIGVEHCSRPSYRVTTSHSWKGKRPLPVSGVHGSQLSVGCWTERYQSFRAGIVQPKETLHCVNGEWWGVSESIQKVCRMSSPRMNSHCALQVQLPAAAAADRLCLRALCPGRRQGLLGKHRGPAAAKVPGMAGCAIVCSSRYRNGCTTLVGAEVDSSLDFCSLQCVA